MIRGRRVNVPKRSNQVLIHGNTFMTLEEAVRHYMSDGIVNLPQAPEGAFEFEESAPSPDQLRAATDASFDRMDAAVMFARQVPPEQVISEPVPNVDTSNASAAD